MAELKLFFDGGCRPNPGPIEVAVVVRGRTFHRADVGIGTNGDAEWLALLYALDVARELEGTDLLLVGDSAMVVTQASGAGKCRTPELRRYLATFAVEARRFTRVRLRHVRRNHNLAGIELDAMRAGI